MRRPACWFALETMPEIVVIAVAPSVADQRRRKRFVKPPSVSTLRFANSVIVLVPSVARRFLRCETAGQSSENIHFPYRHRWWQKLATTLACCQAHKSRAALSPPAPTPAGGTIHRVQSGYTRRPATLRQMNSASAMITKPIRSVHSIVVPFLVRFEGGFPHSG